MKSIFVLTALLVLFACISAEEKAWQRISKQLTVNGNKGYGAVDYSKFALQVRGDVTCTALCDIYLLDTAQFENLRAGRGFTFLQGRTGVYSFTLTTLSDTSIISQGVFAVVVNQNANNLEAKYELEQDIYVENWEYIRRNLYTNGNNGYSAVDFATYAYQIRGTVSCTRTCDIFLMTGTEFNNLRAGRGFSFLQGQRAVTSYTFTTYSNRATISRNVFAVVVNPGSFSLTAEYTLQQDIQRNVTPSDPLGTLLALIIFSPCICLCCCLFIICGILGAARNFILDLFGIQRHRGYGNIGGGYYETGGSSSGGNTYSGTIGGSSGGYSTGYSSNGGNSYSGQI